MCQGNRDGIVVLGVEDGDRTAYMSNMKIAFESKIIFFHRLKKEPVERRKHVTNGAVDLDRLNKQNLRLELYPCLHFLNLIQNSISFFQPR